MQTNEIEMLLETIISESHQLEGRKECEGRDNQLNWRRKDKEAEQWMDGKLFKIAKVVLEVWKIIWSRVGWPNSSYR